MDWQSKKYAVNNKDYATHQAREAIERKSLALGLYVDSVIRQMRLGSKENVEHLLREKSNKG